MAAKSRTLGSPAEAPKDALKDRKAAIEERRRKEQARALAEGLTAPPPPVRDAGRDVTPGGHRSAPAAPDPEIAPVSHEPTVRAQEPDATPSSPVPSAPLVAEPAPAAVPQQAPSHTAPPASFSGERPLAHKARDGLKKETEQTTFAISGAMKALILEWQDELDSRGEWYPSMGVLAVAAFHDLPLEPQEMVDLVGSYPDEVFDGKRYQHSVRLPPETVTRIRRVHTIIRTREVDTKGWKVLAAAMKRQLDAEKAARGM